MTPTEQDNELAHNKAIANFHQWLSDTFRPQDYVKVTITEDINLPTNQNLLVDFSLGFALSSYFSEKNKPLPPEQYAHIINLLIDSFNDLKNKAQEELVLVTTLTDEAKNMLYGSHDIIEQVTQEESKEQLDFLKD